MFIFYFYFYIVSKYYNIIKIEYSYGIPNTNPNNKFYKYFIVAPERLGIYDLKIILQTTKRIIIIIILFEKNTNKHRPLLFLSKETNYEYKLEINLNSHVWRGL